MGKINDRAGRVAARFASWGESAGPIFIAAHRRRSRRQESTVESTGIIRLVSLRSQLYIGIGLDSHIARPRHGGRKPTVQPGGKYGFVFATLFASESAIAATRLIKSIDIE